MKKNILLLFLIITVITSCNTNAANSERDNTVLDDLLIQLDSMSLEDGQALYMKQYNGLIFMLNFMEQKKDIEPTNYTEDDEKEKATDSILTIVPPELYNLASLKKNIAITHDYFDPFDDLENSHDLEDSVLILSSVLKITNDIDYDEEYRECSKYLKYSYTVDSIYYKDGSSRKIGSEIKTFLLLDNLKQIDRVALSVNCPSDLIKITLSDKQKTAQIGDATKITLESIDKNVAKFKVEGKDAGSYVTNQAKTKSGYFVNYSQLNSSTMTKSDLKKFRSTTEEYMGKIANKIEAKEYKNKEEFITDIKENAPQVYIPSESNFREIVVSYKGNVDEINLYFTKNVANSKVRITIPVKEKLSKYNLRIKDRETGKQVILDENTNILVTIPDDSYAYQYNNYYYLLRKKNSEESELHRLDPEKGFTNTNNAITSKYDVVNRDLTDDLLFISLPNEPYKLGALDRLGNVVIPTKYMQLKKSNTENVIIAYNTMFPKDDSKYTLYDLAGKEIASGDGFLSDFSDGLALVKKKDKKGFIDIRGKLAIPFYEDSNDFENGITMVENEDGEKALINTKNEIVLPFQRYNYYRIESTKFARVYVFEDKEYDSAGQRIK